jgi:hypothetical protein
MVAELRELKVVVTGVTYGPQVLFTTVTDVVWKAPVVSTVVVV